MDRKNVIPVIAALVAFLSVSTMLRFPGLPVGVGEVIVMLTAFFFYRRGKFLQNFTHPLMLFWIAFISTAAVGYFVGTVHGEAAIHTGVAYLYAAGFTLIVLAYVGDLSKEEFQRFIRAMGTVPVLLLSVPLLIFLVGSEWFSELLDINTTFYPSRVAAWSTNPNQLALFLLPVPIWLAAISQDTHWKGWRFFKKFLFLWFIFFLGLCVRSDALLLAWSIGIPMLTIIAGCWLKKVNWKFFGSITAAFVLAFVSFKFFFDGPGQQLFETVRKEMSESVESIHAPVTPVTPELNEQEITASRSHIAAPDLAHVTVVEKKNHDTEVAATPEALAFGRSDSAVGVGMDPNKVGVRKTLWIHAYEVWKLSPIFGHGPGAFSYLDSPDDRQEAHNLLLDMLTQVGIVGVALFASVYLWLIIGAVRARDPYSLTLLVILMVFSAAHFMLRQPIFTMYMVICAVLIKNRLFDQADEGLDRVQASLPISQNA